ncbi:hypothetical protein PR202_gn00496 [Eleusine coracana subsp. coracana]|uniref:Endonuclease/exonuclease/phosphatase domain-containing protein n=1 Tax=Eleusine coracana subsp. coracana TaxID=191504 RepID=A0AAV5FZQ0_ELECO|nr:hypothetical protein PR202_gn00496 [Eleusine coracana subsp. coracana]
MLRRVLDGFDCLHPRRRRRHYGGGGAGPAPRVTVCRLGSRDKAAAPPCTTTTTSNGAAVAGEGGGETAVTIRVATFNAAMFSMAPAVSTTATAETPPASEPRGVGLPPPPGSPAGGVGATRRPKGILKAQATQQLARSPSKAARVCINVQDNEISLDRRRWRGNKKLLHHPPSHQHQQMMRPPRSVEEVLRETGADIIGLQNVRAEECRGMRPLSELAEALGMRYVFAESWAPEYGNALLSRWPIKRWKAHRVADPSDFRFSSSSDYGSLASALPLAFPLPLALQWLRHSVGVHSLLLPTSTISLHTLQ